MPRISNTKFQIKMTACCISHNQKPQDKRFQSLGAPKDRNRVWAVSAIHGHAEKLTAIHDAIFERFRAGDKLVYLGNYTGYGDQSVETVDELLTFRRMLLSCRSVVPDDIVYLRGAQEEMWQKLLQLQFATDPTNVLLWMLANGLAATLQSYGLSAHDGIEACRKGVLGIGKWTDSIRAAIRRHPGHETLGTQLMRAAFTDEEQDHPLLFVHSGLDASKSLPEQGDNFWWPRKNFEDIHDAYRPFDKVIRGYDPAHKGFHANCVTATIDGGCGFGGALIGTSFDNAAVMGDVLEA